MRKVNYFALFIWCLLLAACAEQADVKPELNDLRGDPLCIADPFGNCVPGEDDEDDGGPGGDPGGDPGNTGGSGSPAFKVYMQGVFSGNVNQGTSTDGFSWTGQGNVDNVTTDRGLSAVKYGSEIYTFHGLYNGSPGTPQNTVRFSRSNNGGNHWATYSMDNGVLVTTTAATSAVEFENKIYLAYKKANSNHNIEVVSSNGITGWANHSNPVSNTENRDFGEPYLAVHNNELYLFYTNNAGRVFYKKKNTSPQVTWGSAVDITAEVNGNDVLSTGGVTAVSFNNTIHVVYRVHSNYLLATDALSIGTPQGHYVNNAQTSHRPSLATDGSKMVVLYKGNTSWGVRYSSSTNGLFWSGNAFAVGETTQAPYVIRY